MSYGHVPMEVDSDIPDDVFSDTPLWTPRRSNSLTKPALFFQSPKFRELMNREGNQEGRGKKCSCSQHPALKKLSSTTGNGSHKRFGFTSPCLSSINRKRSPTLVKKASPKGTNNFFRKSSLLVNSLMKNSPHLSEIPRGSPLKADNRKNSLILAEMGKSSPFLNEMVKNSPIFNLKEHFKVGTPKSAKKTQTPRLDVLSKSSPFQNFKPKSPRMNILNKRPRVLEVLNLPTPPTKRKSPEESEDPRSIKLTRLLGSGGFGSVYKGMLHGHKVAVKKFHGTKKNVKARLQSFRAESNTIHLQHPNVVSVLASYCEGCFDDSYIVMEYAGHLNLNKLINETGEPLSLRRRIRYALDITKALEYIHDKCVVHLDLKPSNIIISPNDICRLADFGCCQVVEEDTGHVSPINRSYLTGTVAYRAPELLRGEPPCRKADIYSLAITLWQMVAGDQPFPGMNPHVVIFGVVAQNLRPDPPTFSEAHCTQDPIEKGYKELYSQCWAAARLARPSAKHMLHVLTGWHHTLLNRGTVMA